LPPARNITPAQQAVAKKVLRPLRPAVRLKGSEDMKKRACCAATIVAAVITRCEPARLLDVAPTVVVSARHVAGVVAEL